MITVVRTHDEFYLNENRYKKPKQLFLEIIEDIKKTIRNDAGIVLSDFGCAAGEFPYALRQAFPHATIEGYDLLPDLIEKAKVEVPNANFIVGSITDRALAQVNHADYTLCVGVLSIFDAFEPIIDNLLHWTKPGGHVYLHGLFNNYPIDVNIKYNLSQLYGKGVLEAGWNIFSKESVSRWLTKRLDVKNFNFSDLHMEVDFEPQADPARSWTFKDDHQRRIVTNGLCIMQPHSVLHLHKV